MEIIKSLFDGLNGFKDLTNLITSEIRESDILEYKKASDRFTNKEKDEIPKDVSAFANSSGGVLIFGIETDSNDKSKPVKITGVHEANIESFDRVINSQIRKEIKGIQKKIIYNENIKIMVVFVPQSDDSPHQSLVDKKYYRRAGIESIPMEHYLVELYFGKRLSPSLNLQIEYLDDFSIQNLHFTEDNYSDPIKIRLFIDNSGKRVGKYIESIIRFPNLDKVKIVNSGRLQNIDYLYESTKQQARQYTQNQGVFHPGMRKQIVDLTVQINKNWYENSKDLEPLIDWIIYADEMQPKNGLIFID